MGTELMDYCKAACCEVEEMQVELRVDSRPHLSRRSNEKCRHRPASWTRSSDDRRRGNRLWSNAVKILRTVNRKMILKLRNKFCCLLCEGQLFMQFFSSKPSGQSSWPLQICFGEMQRRAGGAQRMEGLMQAGGARGGSVEERGVLLDGLIFVVIAVMFGCGASLKRQRRNHHQIETV